MRARWSLVAMVLSLGVAYVAYPYVTLYRLGSAIQVADAATLESLVDWPAVREGIKEDICDNVADDPQSEGKLPAFGASFVRGIASNAVDQRVTAEGLVGMTHHDASDAAVHAAAMSVTWAFFRDPTDFVVSLYTPGQSEPIKLRMNLTDGGWQVTRIWLPPAMLDQANARTS